jgi:hypothetical protein
MKHVTLGVLALVALAGCRSGASYSVTPLYPTEPADFAAAAGGLGGVVAERASHRLEVLPEKLDGHWFERRIYPSRSSTPDAIELVYCPLVKDGPTVCRSATIWVNGSTELLEPKRAK